MGILNITPDSFYDGGRHSGCADALAQAQRLLAGGADIIDLGGESTRPGSSGISPQEETGRLLPVFDAVKEKLPGAVISIDTWHSETAAFFLERGADIINDVSGLAWDEKLLETVVPFNPGYVLTHSIGRPGARQFARCHINILDEVKSFFAHSLARLARAGMDEENIVLDPGIGFGKNLAHNLTLLKNVAAFLEFGRPLLLGISMKSWLGNLLGLPLAERSRATATASALLWQKGVFWHRVHEPAPVREALELACALA